MNIVFGADWLARRVPPLVTKRVRAKALTILRRMKLIAAWIQSYRKKAA